MDLLEDVLVENWSSFDAAESSNFMLELLGDYNPSFAMQSMSWSEHDHAVDSHFWSQEHHPSINSSTGTTTSILPPYILESYSMSGPSVLQEFDSNTHSMGFSNIGPIGSIGNPTRNGIAIGDTSTVKRKNEDCQGESHKKSKITATKVQKSSSTSTTVEANWQKFKCCSSDSESYASQELNAVVQASSACEDSRVVNLKGKTRSSRGSATDPQSLYARKRRERINERLRTLQNLVPNGTKVDISTMLEEAVQYVKLLQLQIKLLSSDELWMYAPFAYNGMNIGLDLKNFPTQQ